MMRGPSITHMDAGTGWLHKLPNAVLMTAAFLQGSSQKTEFKVR